MSPLANSDANYINVAKIPEEMIHDDSEERDVYICDNPGYGDSREV